MTTTMTTKDEDDRPGRVSIGPFCADRHEEGEEDFASVAFVADEVPTWLERMTLFEDR